MTPNCHTDTVELYMEPKNITSKELLEKLRISKDTLKHWRYGYYISSEQYRVYYREDMAGVPCSLINGKSFDFYEYDLVAVTAWVESWRIASQKKISILKKLATIARGEVVGEVKKKTIKKKKKSKKE